MCFVLMYTTGLVCVVKGCQQYMSKLHNDADVRHAWVCVLRALIIVCTLSAGKVALENETFILAFSCKLVCVTPIWHCFSQRWKYNIMPLNV